MKYLGKSFSTPANSRAYVENWERVFGEKRGEAEADELPHCFRSIDVPGCECAACKLLRALDQL